MKKLFKGIFTMTLVSILFMGGAKAYSTSDITAAQSSLNPNRTIHHESIPIDYSFALGSKKGALTSQSSQVQYSVPDTVKNKWNSDRDGAYSTLIAANSITSLANDNIKGKFYVIYKDVDVYNDKIIDVKATVTNFGKSSNPTSDPVISIHTKEIDFSVLGIDWLEITYEFIDEDGKTIDLQGNTTYYDIDADQGVIMNNGNVGIYTSTDPACKLKLSSISGAPYMFEPDFGGTNDYQLDYGFTETFKTTNKKLVRTYTFVGDQTSANGPWGGIRNFSNPVTPSEIPDPTKKVNKSTVKPGEEYEYTITQKVNNVIKGYRYKSFKIEDTLESVLDANAANVTVKNSKGNVVTNNFDIAVSGQKITVSAKSSFLDGDGDEESNYIYGDKYDVIIKTKVKADADLSKYQNNIIPNHATRTYTDYANKEHTKDTDIVNVKVEPYKLIVHHLEEGTNKKLADDETYDKKYNESYSTSKSDKVINDGYELVSTPSNASGTIIKDTEVTYYYKKQSSIVVNVPKTMANISKVLLGIGVIAVIASGVVIYKNTKKNK